MDAGQKTESLAKLVSDIDAGSVVLPEFQRDFVWEIERTFDLFDSFIRDIFVGSLIYGVPSFEVTVREIDNRPRTGTGSRKRLKLTSYSKPEIEKLSKTNGFRLLLDGQQRATSIYRALKGIDELYIVLLPDETDSLKNIPISKRSLEEVLEDIRNEPVKDRISIRLSDVYRMLNGEYGREKEKAALFLKSSRIKGLNEENVEISNEFLTYLTQSKNLENLFRQEKLVSYYLLDTDEEKFALFFERSNSRGIQLNFIDILAAKLYGGFNLREHIEAFSDDGNQKIKLNREVIVRSICYKVSKGKELGRSYILAQLNATHFKDNWDDFIRCYKNSYEYLLTTHLLIHQDWMPYENMLIPLMVFISQIKGRDFSQISESQSRIIKTWYWLAILSRRYSSAAQTYALEDAQAFEKLANGDHLSATTLLQKLSSSIKSIEDFYSIYKKFDALYKGILNFCNLISGGFRNLENGNPITYSSSLEDHHIFPKDYLKKYWIQKDSAVDASVLTDCVLNRTLIPKLTNIKVSNKRPSAYLGELLSKNSNLATALKSHLIPESVMSGDYDDVYQIFLEDRAKIIMDQLQTIVLNEREAILAEFSKK